MPFQCLDVIQQVPSLILHRKQEKMKFEYAKGIEKNSFLIIFYQDWSFLTFDAWKNM